MPPERRVEKINKVVDWIIEKLENMKEAKDKAEQQNKEITFPEYLRIKQIIPDVGISYQTLANYSIYYEIEKRFLSLTYKKQTGKWKFNEDFLERDLKNKDKKYLEKDSEK
ncbi:MAG: hypothetical protein ACLFUH_04025 [Bacteroidales bacterium]